MQSGVIFLLHPDTGMLYSITEASEMIGVKHSTIHGRIKRGDHGPQIWRPTGTNSEDYSAENTFDTNIFIKYRQNEEIYL